MELERKKRFVNNPLKVGDYMYLMGPEHINALSIQVKTITREDNNNRTKYIVYQSGDYSHYRRNLYLYDNNSVQFTVSSNAGSSKSVEKSGTLSDDYIELSNGEVIYRSFPTFQEMFMNATSMSGEIEFADFLNSIGTHNISPKYFSNMFTGSNASFKSFENTDPSIIGVNNFQGSNLQDYVHNNNSLAYFVALDVSKDLGLGSNGPVHRTDIGNPNLWQTQNVDNMHGLFAYTKFNKIINDWNTSNVTNMKSLFQNNPDFNKEINSWDTGNVTTMRYMFWHASKFNQDLGSWDMSKVTDTNYMFRASYAFEDGNIYRWNVSSLNDSGGMFTHANLFNGRIQSLADEWSSQETYDLDDVVLHNSILYKSVHTNLESDSNINQDPSSATTYWQVHTWNSDGTYRQNELIYHDNKLYISLQNENHDEVPNALDSAFWKEQNVADALLGWDRTYNPLSQNRTVTSMFASTLLFNQPLDKLNMKGIKNLNGMFQIAKSFDQELSNWDTSDATNMSYMFASAQKFNSAVDFDTSKVTTMEGMFGFENANWRLSNNKPQFHAGAIKFNQPVNFDTGSVTNMACMFADARNFNQPLNFDVNVVTDFGYMFYKAYKFDQDLSYWVKNSDIATSSIGFSEVSNDRRIFVQNVHRDDDSNKTRYVTIRKTETGFETIIYENGSIRQSKNVNITAEDSYDMDKLYVYFELKITNIDLVFIHYGKRIDVHVLTEYATWNEQSYDTNTIVYNSDEDKYYKALQTTSESWIISEWGEYTTGDDLIHEDITSDQVSNIDNEWLKYFGFASQQGNNSLLFKSSKYIYTFGIGGSLTSTTFSLNQRFHNNPNVINKYKGKVVGVKTSDLFTNRYRTGGDSQVRETKEELMEQKVLSSKYLGDNFFMVICIRDTDYLNIVLKRHIHRILLSLTVMEITNESIKVIH